MSECDTAFDKETERALVDLIVRTVHPKRIILFGSAAQGSMGLHSDIDVLVVVSEGVNRRHAAQDIYEESIGFDHAIDVVVATERDLETHGGNSSLVFYPALREGKEIYAA